MARISTAMDDWNGTILGVALRILRRSKGYMSPRQIAQKGVESGLLRIPRGRTKGYLSQLIQSSLYNNAAYGDRPLVRRKAHGKYGVR